MSLINIPAFSGLNILAAPQRIRDDEATVAVGCDFRSLDLRPFKGDKDSGIGTTVAGAIANVIAEGASTFQWDAATWVAAKGDKNFARSPTFFADATTGQRVFACDNAAPYPTNSTDFAWNWVQEIEKENLTLDTSRGPNSKTYFLNGSAVRLGVPKPDNIPDPTYTKRAGALTRVQVSTGTNAFITIPTADADGLMIGDKVFINSPGFAPAAYSITEIVPYPDAEGETKVTLRNTKRSWRQVKMKVTQGSANVEFALANHGFFGGEQIFLSHLNSTATGMPRKNNASIWPTETLEIVWIVDYISSDTFGLSYYTYDQGSASWVLRSLELTDGAAANPDTGGPNTTWTKKIALLSPADYSFDAANAVTISLTQTNYQATGYYAFANGTQEGSWETAEEALTERSYVVTFVNKFGDESEPSNPTATFPVAQKDPVTFVTFPVIAATYPAYLVTGPGGSYMTGEAPILERYRIPEKIRLYRTDASGTYRLVTTEATDERTLLWSEVANVDGSPKTINWVDTYEDSELGEPLQTTGWQIPPRDLNGVLISPGGSLVGYKGRSVLGSVPYAPYAFPIANRVAFDYNVKGLVATSSGLVVVTDGMPSLIVGDDPGAWSIQKLEYPYGCVSRRSIVDMGEMAIYASADGLVGIAGASVQILTKDAMTRAQWQAIYNPTEIFASHAEGRYYGVTKVGNTYKAFMFDPRTRTFVDLTVDPAKYPLALYNRLEDDTLLILKSDGIVYEWNRGDDWVPYTWRSKYFQLTKPDILGCCQVMSPALIGNHKFTMRLIAWDGDTIYTIALFSNKTTQEGFATLPAATWTSWEAERRYPFSVNVNPFRLPVPNNRYFVYQVELEGTLPIAQVSLASVIDELKQV